MNIKKQEKEIDATRKFFLRSEIKGFASGNPEVLKSSVSKKEAVTTYKFSAKDKPLYLLEEELCPPSLVEINAEKECWESLEWDTTCSLTLV